MYKRVTKRINNQDMDCIDVSCDRCGTVIMTWYIDISIEQAKEIDEKYYRYYIRETEEILCKDCFNAFNRL